MQLGSLLTEADDLSQQGIAIMCDPTKFRFSIRADANMADLDPSYPIVKIVSLRELFFNEGLPGWTGQIEIMAPIVRYERCGPYTFKLSGDAYNTNMQGESGAYGPFASVSVLRGNGLLYPTDGGVVRFTVCDRSLPRARPCPDGYAIRLDARYDARRKKLQLIEINSSFEEGVTAGQKTVVRRFDLKEDLDMWHPR